MINKAMEWKSYFKKNAKQRLKGKRVLITGAAQGIGLQTAAQFAEAGSNLILTDINEEKLAEARRRLAKKGVKIDTYVVDVTDKDAVSQLANEVLEKYGKLDILINNAGIGHHDELEDTDLPTWQKLIDVNLWGPLYHIYAFLPAMKEAGEGHIVNVSSGQAFFRLPTWGAYAAIKLAMGVISEIMHYELKRYGIRVTTVYPYMVNTGFYNDVETDSLGAKLSMALLPLYSQKPETVAKIIFKAVLRKKRIEMVNPLNTMAKYMHMLPPVSDVMNKAITFVLSDTNSNQLDKIPGIKMMLAFLMNASSQIQARAGQVGFQMEELMQGEHEFEEGFGPKGKQAMHFKVVWGTDQLLEWLNPFSEEFMLNNLDGTVTIGGLCEDAPCQGTLALQYFTAQKIRYTFDFEVEGEAYQFIGEKRNIYPWNLPYSHTCCFGELRLKESNELVSTSITHFKLDTLPAFLKSFQLVR
jgi:short-subunit dehydrogenase